MPTESAAYRPFVRPVLATGLILMIPFVAMRLTAEMRWSATDFAVAGVLVVGMGLLLELAMTKAADPAYRAAAGIALAAALLLVWLSIGVGIIGADGDPANLMYFGVLGVGVVGAGAARFRAPGMARALFAMALAQTIVGLIALVARLGYPASRPLEILGLTGLFVALFAASGWLFRNAGRRQSPVGA